MSPISKHCLEKLKIISVISKKKKEEKKVNFLQRLQFYMLREKHEKNSKKNNTIRNTLRVPLQTELAQELKLGIGFNENWTVDSDGI